MRFHKFEQISVCALGLALASVCGAQNATTPSASGQQTATAPAVAAPAPPAPLPTPSITGPLSNLPPAEFDAGPFGKLAVNGFLSGMGLVQNNHIGGDDSKQAALSNGQVFIQKTDGWFQFYLQA